MQWNLQTNVSTCKVISSINHPTDYNCNQIEISIYYYYFNYCFSIHNFILNFKLVINLLHLIKDFMKTQNDNQIQQTRNINIIK